MVSLGLNILDVAIVLIITALGMSTQLSDILVMVRNPKIAARALLALFVFMPACALLLTWSLPLEPGIRASLLALSVAPLAPILSKATTQPDTEGDFMLGLQILSALAAIIAIPILMALSEIVF